jgi:SAM-dependent methyltransferase
MKPHSDACERNREPILKVIKDWFIAPGSVLEIGSGTGQHAVYFAEHLPHLQWIATDRAENHAGIAAWIEDARLPNVRGPLPLDVCEETWPVEQVDYVFSANTAHIMSWPEVEQMFAGIGRVLRAAGVFCLYGPFNCNGQFTSDSNRAFDEALKARDPRMGIRDDQALIALAKQCALDVVADYSMPAKNRILVWRRDALA